MSSARRYHDSFAMKENSIQSFCTTRPIRRVFAVATLLVLWACWASSASAKERRTENVLLVTYDGLRRQELFAGADESLLNREHGGVRDVDALRARFWNDDPLRRREALLPFFWNVVAPQGQVFGASDVGSSVRVTNGLYFSYPGYNEILSGAADARTLPSAWSGRCVESTWSFRHASSQPALPYRRTCRDRRTPRTAFKSGQTASARFQHRAAPRVPTLR